MVSFAIIAWVWTTAAAVPAAGWASSPLVAILVALVHGVDQGCGQAYVAGRRQSYGRAHHIQRVHRKCQARHIRIDFASHVSFRV
jgi:hypothetical protein